MAKWSVITNKMTSKGYILLEVTAAAAITAIAALSLSAALITAAHISAAAQAVTRGRLLAHSHLEQAAAGVAPTCLSDGPLSSTLTIHDVDGTLLWQVEVRGPNLHKPLKIIGGP